MYNPELARYMQPDPIGVNGGMNIYSYVENNPLNASDPEGLLFGVDTITFAVVGGVTNGVVNGFNYYNQGKGFWKGAFIGGVSGAVTGAVFSYNPFIAGGVGGVVTQFLNRLNGVTTFDNPICDIAFAGTVGAVTGSIAGISGGMTALNISLKAGTRTVKVGSKKVVKQNLSTSTIATLENQVANVNNVIYGMQFNTTTNLGGVISDKAKKGSFCSCYEEKNK